LGEATLIHCIDCDKADARRPRYFDKTIDFDAFDPHRQPAPLAIAGTAY
jgi:hypothetical protein